MTERTQLFDAGLQPERTALAWRRTGLALVAGSVIAIRVIPEAVGAWTLIPSGLGLLLSMSVIVAAEGRYRANRTRLTWAHGPPEPLAAGVLPAVVAGMALLLGLGAFTFTLFR